MSTQVELNLLANLTVYHEGVDARVTRSDNGRVVVLTFPSRDAARTVLRALADADLDFGLTVEPFNCRRTGHTHRIILEAAR